MSDTYSLTESEARAPLSITVSTGKADSIERAKNMLAGVDKGFRNALGASLRRTVTSTKAYAAKKIRSEYYVSSGDFKRFTHTHSKIGSSNGETDLSVEFYGYHIPLLKFDTRVSKDGRVSTRVKRASTRETLNHAFFSTMKNGHTGLYERETDERLPIREFFGPSTPQMMSYNDEVREDIAKHQEETFEKRLDHEVTRILNGWR